MKWRWWVRGGRYTGDTKLSWLEQQALKKRILNRLAAEDYTRRIPLPIKPRIRYRLRRYTMVIGGKNTKVWS